MTEPTPLPVRLTVGDAAVARIAEDRARRVPGVVAFRADLSQALLGVADTILGRPLRTDGVTAAVRGPTGDVSVTVVTRLGHNCRDLAQAVQLAVAAEVAELTGLVVEVGVTVADVVVEQ